MKKKTKKLYSQERKRFLKKIFGKCEKPRLSIFKSNKHIYGQIINDENGTTLVFKSTLNKDISKNLESTSNCIASKLVGQKIAEEALEKNIKYVVFDRGSKPYHGRIKTLAEGAREKGLIF